MARDYYARVPWREEELANDAQNVRRKHGYADNLLSFNIMDCVQRLDFSRNVPRQHFDLTPGEDPVYVTYNPLTLHLAKEIRDGAYRNEEYARVVVAHEISHLRLHSDGLNSFSFLEGHKETWHVRERSVEWQARTWTGYFLLPDCVVRMYESAEQIVELCRVDFRTANSRFEAFQERERRRAAAGLCPGCRDFVDLGQGLCDACSRQLLRPRSFAR